MGTVRHEFREGPDQQRIIFMQAPLNFRCTIAPPPDWNGPVLSEQATRLLYVKLAKPGSIPTTAVFDMFISGNVADPKLVVGRAGYGPDKMEKTPHLRPFKTPLKMDIPPDGKYHIAYADGEVTVNDKSGITFLTPDDGERLELRWGFDKSTRTLVPPIGWVLELETDEPVEVEPDDPEKPTDPPVEEPPVIVPPVEPVEPVEPDEPDKPKPDASAELRRDLQALLLKYASAKGIDPLLLFALQLAISRR